MMFWITDVLDYGLGITDYGLIVQVADISL